MSTARTLLAVAALAAPIAAQDRPDPLAAAAAAEAVDEFAIAIDHYRRALVADPGDPTVHWRLGRVLAWNGDWPAAEQHLRRALELDPGFHDARVTLGHLLGWMGRDEEAEAAFAAVLAQDPDHLDAATASAHLAWRRGDPDRALAAYGAVLAREPDHVDALVGRARVWRSRRRFIYAHRDLGAAWRASPDADSVHRALFDLRPDIDPGLSIDTTAAVEYEDEADGDRTAVRLATLAQRWRLRLPLGPTGTSLALGSDHVLSDEDNELAGLDTWSAWRHRAELEVRHLPGVHWTLTGALALAAVREREQQLFAVVEEDEIEWRLGARYDRSGHGIGLDLWRDGIYAKDFDRLRVRSLDRTNLVASYAWRGGAWSAGLDGALRWFGDDNRERGLEAWIAHPVPGARSWADLELRCRWRAFDHDEPGYYSFAHEFAPGLGLHLHHEWHQRSLIEGRAVLGWTRVENGSSRLGGDSEDDTETRLGWDLSLRWRRIHHSRHAWHLDAGSYGDTEGYLAVRAGLGGIWHF